MNGMDDLEANWRLMLMCAYFLAVSYTLIQMRVRSERMWLLLMFILSTCALSIVIVIWSICHSFTGLYFHSDSSTARKATLYCYSSLKFFFPYIYHIMIATPSLDAILSVTMTLVKYLYMYIYFYCYHVMSCPVMLFCFHDHDDETTYIHKSLLLHKSYWLIDWLID